MISSLPYTHTNSWLRNACVRSKIIDGVTTKTLIFNPALVPTYFDAPNSFLELLPAVILMLTMSLESFSFREISISILMVIGVFPQINLTYIIEY